MQELTSLSCMKPTRRAIHTSSISTRSPNPIQPKGKRLVFHFADPKNSRTRGLSTYEDSIRSSFPKAKAMPSRQSKKTSPSLDIKIKILTEDSLPPIQTTINPAFLTAISTINESSFTTASTNSHLNTPSPSSSSRPEKLKRKVGKAARHLSKDECEKIVVFRDKELKSKKVVKCDWVNKMLKDDEKSFKDELLFRKFRKHKYIRGLPIKFEDSWDWSSYGSESPTHRVRFSELVD